MKRLSFREMETQRDPDFGGQTGDTQGVLLARFQTPGNVRLCLSLSCSGPGVQHTCPGSSGVMHPGGWSRRDHYGSRSSQRWAMALPAALWEALLCFSF